MKKYIIELEEEIYGRIVIQAENRTEAEEKADIMFAKFSRKPDWWEWGTENVKSIREVKNKKDFDLIEEEQLEDYTKKIQRKLNLEVE